VYERVNVTGTANLLALLAEHGTERFIYMSSRASRADCGAYGASKDRAAALVRASPIPSIILEPGEVYGGSSADALSSVVRLATRFGIVLRVAPATLAPVHIDDVIAATVATLSVPATGQTYVLTGPETLTLTEIGERATSGRFALHVYVPTWALRVLARIAQIAGSTSIVEDQVDRYLCEKPSDSSSARRDLGFSPRPFKP
jgi:NADH dehydrogenase